MTKYQSLFMRLKTAVQKFINKSFPSILPKSQHSIFAIIEERSQLFRLTGPSEYIRVMRTMAPWRWHPYEKQLQLIEGLCRFSLTKLGNKVRSNTANPPHAFMQQLNLYGGLPCEIQPVIPSPVVEGYRNKSRYITGRGIYGDPTVGFYVPPGNFPFMAVANHEDLISEHPLHYKLAMVFQEFLRSSDIPSLGSMIRCGPHWKGLVIRSNRKHEMCVGVVFDSDKSPKEYVDSVKQTCIDFFIHGPGKDFNIKSLHFQDCPLSDCQRGQAPFEHLHGEPSIYETLHGYKFSLKPGNFFQINTEGAELLYEKVREYAGLTKDTILLDVCCGTGTIGILMSKYVKHVIGIESIASSVEGAKECAELNGVENIEFICGKVESKLKYVTRDLIGCDVVAVLNPSRGGLGNFVMRNLRCSEAVRRVVYVSCKPFGRPLYNLTLLCQSSEKLGEPFLPKRAVAIDMFPFTKHFELVMALER